ncbi:MAG TPA: hypothetical protein DCR01_02095 [Flavobacteriales bacterium]|nr:hypothetical protein [Flavobacteriales bacterium]
MNHIFRILAFVLVGLSSSAQNESNSPYSRFGLGDLQSFSTATQSAMGGVGIASYDPLSINVINPASYSSVFAQRFTMQTGGIHTTKLLQTSTQNQVVNSTNFNYLMFSFPLSKFWGTSVGLLPYSEKSYSFSDAITDPSADLLFEGNGGLTRIYFGNSTNVNKNLSIGANLNYLFGNLNSSRKVFFNDVRVFNTKINEDINIKGFYFDFGLMYKAKLGKWNSVLGFTMDNGSEISAEKTSLIETFRSGGEFELIEDTISFDQQLGGSLVLPTSMGFGLALSNEQWKIMADYKSDNWEEYNLFGTNDDLENSSRLALGFEFVPDKKSINRYYKMIRYRLGMYSSKTYLNLKNQQLDEKAITLGFGLPLKRSGSLVNLSAELGQMGTTDDGLIQESFARFKIGFIFSDIWFIKRKYD